MGRSYLYDWGKNVVGLEAFKAHFAIWFFHGALMKDPDKVLINAQEGRTQGLRQWRFEKGDPIDESRILAYVDEAIGNQMAGKMVKANRSKSLEIPPELQNALRADQTLHSAFEALTLTKKGSIANM